MKKTIKIFLLLLLFSCENKKSEVVQKRDEQPISINQPKRDISEIKIEALNGDMDAYEELRIAYLDYPIGSLFYFSFMIANKFNYPRAYLDVYYSIIPGHGSVEELHKVDKHTRKFAIEYLTIAATKGEKEAKELLVEIRKKGF